MQDGDLRGYRLDKEIGSGGMGTVHRAGVLEVNGELRPGDVVAVKVIHPHLAADPGYLERFLREAEIGRRIRHPNVVRTFGAGRAETKDGPRHFIVLEYVEGQTLRALLDEMDRVPEGLCRHIGREVALALDAVHEVGVIHRDLKPENVLITQDEKIKVMDLGVARILDGSTRLSQPGAFVGSLEYAAPEQLQGASPVSDPRSDLFSLGLLLYELSTAVHPFRAASPALVIRRLLEEIPPRCGELNAQLSAFFEQVLQTLLEKEPARRVGTAAELACILEDAEAGDWWRTRARDVRDRTRQPPRRSRIPRATRLYGRERELSDLAEVYQDVKAGHGRVVLLEGEPGVGKSRLVDEFVSALRRRGESPHFLHGAYPPGGGGVQAGALVSAYREHLGTDGLEAELRRYLPATPTLVPSFAALLQGDLTPEGSPGLTNDALQTAFVHLTHSLASECPLVLLVDDLHRAGDESRAVFATLAHGCVDDRVLLIGTYEQGRIGGWKADLTRAPHVRSMVLDRLGPAAVAALLEEALHSRRLARELAPSLCARTDGNPFFVFEVLDMLREEGALVPGRDGSWTGADPMPVLRIPSSVIDLVQARFERLDRDERDLLGVAACLGNEFDPLLAGRVLDWDPLPTLRRFAHIEREHRLVGSSGRRMRFDHPTVRDALYDGLGGPLKEQLHRRIADLLAAQVSEEGVRDGARIEAIFEHALQSHEHELTRTYMDRALKQLVGAHLRERAVELSERCLQEQGLLDGSGRLRLLLFLQLQLGHLGRNVRRREVTDEATELAERLGDQQGEARARSARGLALWSLGKLDEAREELNRAGRLAREGGDDAQAGLVSAQVGIVLQSMGSHEEAEARFRAYLEQAERDGFLEGQASALTNLGLIAQARGDVPRARALFERSYILAEQSGARTWQANAAGNLAAVFYVQGQWDETHRQTRRFLELSQEIGHRVGESRALSGLGLVAFARGRYAEALDHQEDALRLFRAMDDSLGESLCQFNLACIHRALGRAEEALAASSAQARLAEESGNRRHRASAETSRGQALLLAGRLEEAREALRHARSAHDELGAARESGLDHLLLGRVAEALGEHEEAASEFRAASEAGEALDLANLRVLAGLLGAFVEGRSGADVAAVPDADFQRLERDEQLEVRHLQFRLTGDPRRLVQAKRILEELVASAPTSDRATMLAVVPLYRDVSSATVTR